TDVRAVSRTPLERGRRLRCAAARPQAPTHSRIAGRKDQTVAQPGHHGDGLGALQKGGYLDEVGDPPGPGRGAVAAPEIDSGAVVRQEVHDAVDRRHDGSVALLRKRGRLE